MENNREYFIAIEFRCRLRDGERAREVAAEESDGEYDLDLTDHDGINHLLEDVADSGIPEMKEYLENSGLDLISAVMRCRPSGLFDHSPDTLENRVSRHYM